MKKIILLVLLFSCLPLFLNAKPKKEKPVKIPESITTCTDQNLLVGITPKIEGQVSTWTQNLTNNKAYDPGAFWSSSDAVIVGTSSSLTYDLGHETTLSGLWIQADNNDDYLVEGSLDGSTYTPIYIFPPVNTQGLQNRWIGTLSARARYLRFSASGGDNYYSISELGAYCKNPTPFPPRTEILPSQKTTTQKPEWDDEVVTRYKLYIVGAALVIFSVGYYLKRIKKDKSSRFARVLLLTGIAAFAYASYYNFFHWHFENNLHTWEIYHYYMGSKYFPELGYPGLYECTTLADSEEGLSDQVRARKIRDHRSNHLRNASYVLDDPDLCKAGFTTHNGELAESRWKDFKQDLKWFRGIMSRDRWANMQQDHGYNPPPVWTMIGRFVGSFFDPNTESMNTLANLDILIVLIAFGFVWWAFGWEGLLLAVIIWGTNYASRYYWIGGAFLRQSWLVSMIIGLSLLKKRKHAAAGFMLSLSTLITIFPVMFIFAFGLKIITEWIQKKKLDRDHLKFIIGGAIGGLLLFSASIPAAGRGFNAYKEFAKTISVHMGTPLTNNMGLKTVMSFRPSTKAEKMYNSRLEDPFADWKVEIHKAYDQIKILYYLICVGFIFLVWRANRTAEDWEAAAAGFILIPMFNQLTCYYYSFFTAGALIATRRPRLGIALLITNLTWLYAEFNWNWFDVKYTYISLMAVLSCLYFIWEMGNKSSIEEFSNTK